MLKTYQFSEISNPDHWNFGVHDSGYYPVEAESAAAALESIALTSDERAGEIIAMNPDSATVRLASGRDLCADLVAPDETA